MAPLSWNKRSFLEVTVAPFGGSYRKVYVNLDKIFM